MYMLGRAKSAAAGSAAIGAVLDDGQALKKFHDMIIEQGVDPNVATTICETPDNGILPCAKFTTPLSSSQTGILL